MASTITLGYGAEKSTAVINDGGGSASGNIIVDADVTSTNGLNDVITTLDKVKQILIETYANLS